MRKAGRNPDPGYTMVSTLGKDDGGRERRKEGEKDEWLGVTKGRPVIAAEAAIQESQAENRIPL